MVEEMISGVFKKAWRISLDNFVVLIIAGLITLVGSLLIVTAPPLFFGLFYICIRLYSGEDAKISDVFKGFEYFLTSWGIALLGGLAVAIGLVLLVIPGLLLSIVFQYAAAIALIEKKGAIDSLKRSFELGKKNFEFSLILWILIAVINQIAGVIGIAVVLSIPFTTLLISIAAVDLVKKR